MPAWRWIAVLTTVHLEVAIGAADDLMIRDHVKRFIAVLLRLAGLRYDDAPERGTVDVHVNQDEIAYMANVARTTAGAILRDLEARGSVDLTYRNIKIIDAGALRERLADDRRYSPRARRHCCKWLRLQPADHRIARKGSLLSSPAVPRL